MWELDTDTYMMRYGVQIMPASQVASLVAALPALGNLLKEHSQPIFSAKTSWRQAGRHLYTSLSDGLCAYDCKDLRGDELSLSPSDK